MALSCAVCLALLLARPRSARAEQLLVEISDGAATLIDARATRRLMQLELADIDVPAAGGAKRAPAPMFFRVVQMQRELRVELWVRGEYHGARTVAGTDSTGQLAARRVALAAAELARRLQKKRQAQAARERAEATARALRAEAEARRALDGVFALRPSLAVADIGSAAAVLVGPRLFAQWAFSAPSPRTRLELGLTSLIGSAPKRAESEWLELSLALLQRVSLTEQLDLDLGLQAAAASVRLSHVLGVDAIPGQSETWSARAALTARIEPRLSRHFRLSLAAEAGPLLRAVPLQPLAGGSERLRGAWLALDLGVVFTPR